MRIEGRYRSDLLLLTGELILGLVVAVALFSLNRRNLLGYIDGQYLLTLMNNQAEFSAPGPVFSTNPLEGLVDVWYFANTLWIPEFSLAGLFSNPTVRVVIVQTAAFLEIMATVSLFAYWLHGVMSKAVASGWLAGLAIFPFSYPSLLYNVSPDAPQLAFLTVIPIAMVPLLAAIGRGSLVRDAAIGAAIVILAWIHFIGIGLFVALTYPFLGIIAMVLLVAARHNRGEFVRKLLWGGAIAAILFVSGLPQILLGFCLESAFQFFPQDLAHTERALSEGSLLFRRSEPFGVVLAATGIFGALHSAWFGSGRMRQFGTAVAILAALICIASLLNVFVGFRGAIPIYYEYVLWPIYPIFTVSLLNLFLNGALKVGYAHARFAPKPFERVFLRTTWLTLPLLGLAILHGPHYLHRLKTDRPNVFPPDRTQITEFLHNEVGLSAGSPFRGRVATITGHDESDTSWNQAFTDDIQSIRDTRNDHRTIGLWYYNIPTLIEFSHTIRPRLYLVTKELLANETDAQLRNILNFRRSNLDVLRLLGVRYLVTDSLAPAVGMRRVQSMAPADGHVLAVDELPNPNLGVSPTQILVRTDRDALRWLAQSKIDFDTVALVSDEGIGAGGLSRATDVNVIIERGGMRVHAASLGDAFIVLPIQFSHCLRAFAESGSAQPGIVRADFLLTGLLFHGKLDARIEYRQGPFIGVSCGLDDLHDDREDLRFEFALH